MLALLRANRVAKWYKDKIDIFSYVEIRAVLTICENRTRIGLL